MKDVWGGGTQVGVGFSNDFQRLRVVGVASMAHTPWHTHTHGCEWLGVGESVCGWWLTLASRSFMCGKACFSRLDSHVCHGVVEGVECLMCGCVEVCVVLCLGGWGCHAHTHVWW